jgi:hypothetical protein
MATTTNYSWSTPDDTALVKDGAAAIRSLGTAIDSTVFTNAGNAIAKTIVDAKGDLIVATAADTVARLASSASNGDLLTVDTSTASGLKWAAPAASGGMTLISETTASTLSSLSLSSIPQSYKQLMLVWHGIVHNNNSSEFGVRLNNNSGGVYNGGFLSRNGSNSGGGLFSDIQVINDTYPLFGSRVNVGTSNQQQAVKGSLLIDNYSSSTKHKFLEGNVSFQWDPTNDNFARVAFFQGTFSDTTAITSIDIVRLTGTATFTNNTGTSIRLYGIS